jgi:PleD family two-component response regulator
MERLGALLAAADKALYQAKANGRDRVERYDEAPARPA